MPSESPPRRPCAERVAGAAALPCPAPPRPALGSMCPASPPRPLSDPFPARRYEPPAHGCSPLATLRTPPPCPGAGVSAAALSRRPLHRAPRPLSWDTRCQNKPRRPPLRPPSLVLAGLSRLRPTPPRSPGRKPGLVTHWSPNRHSLPSVEVTGSCHISHQWSRSGGFVGEMGLRGGAVLRHMGAKWAQEVREGGGRLSGRSWGVRTGPWGGVGGSRHGGCGGGVEPAGRGLCRPV